MKLLSWLQNYNSRHSLMEGGAYLRICDDGSCSLVYDEQTIETFDLYEEESLKDYLLNQ